MVGNLDQEVETPLSLYFPPNTDSGASQVRRIPSMRLDFIFEEPLHPGCMFGRSAGFERAADVFGRLCRREPGQPYRRLSHRMLRHDVLFLPQPQLL